VEVSRVRERTLSDRLRAEVLVVVERPGVGEDLRGVYGGGRSGIVNFQKDGSRRIERMKTCLETGRVVAGEVRLYTE